MIQKKLKELFGQPSISPVTLMFPIFFLLWLAKLAFIGLNNSKGFVVLYKGFVVLSSGLVLLISR